MGDLARHPYATPHQLHPNPSIRTYLNYPGQSQLQPQQNQATALSYATNRCGNSYIYFSAPQSSYSSNRLRDGSCLTTSPEAAERQHQQQTEAAAAAAASATGTGTSSSAYNSNFTTNSTTSNSTSSSLTLTATVYYQQQQQQLQELQQQQQHHRQQHSTQTGAGDNDNDKYESSANANAKHLLYPSEQAGFPLFFHFFFSVILT